MSNGPIAWASLYCPNCGNPTPYDAATCPQCGNSLPSAAAVQPTMSLPQSRTVPSQVRPAYGGFWLRLVAAFLDGLLVQVVVMPVSFIIGAAIGMAGGAVSMPELGTQIVGMIAGFTLGLLGGWLYEAVMESSQKQATFGKMLLGLKVTDEQGNRISFARASGRHFAKYISGMILFIGYIMAGFTEKKQALHDMIAGTLVVRQ